MNEQREAVIHTTVFYSYAHADESLREELEKHLSNLRRQGVITEWHDRQIFPGANWAYTIDTHLNTASIILLLISADFLASEYCYCIEMQRALERHKNGEARVIPIILRPVDMEGTPFAHLQCLPRDAVPVTLWTNQDEAFRDIAIGIRTTIEHLHTPSSHQIPSPPTIFVPSKQEMLTFSSSSSTPKNTNRQRMLERVQTIWITGLLKQSLQGATPIALELHKQPNLVENPWRLALQEIDEPTQLLPPDMCIMQVYDHTNHELLILGEPGSGKTTLLLELARDLINRAFHDDTYPMPIIFNLSSWALKRLPLTQWLVEELNNKYQVPRKLAQSWIDDDKVLLLLDGLDEVDIACREACIQAINTYRQEHGLVPLVICSRSAEYLAQKTRVLIRSAVVVQPLTAQQIDDYLSNGGEQLEALRTVLYEDSTLQELATTPLMLSIMALAYQGKYVKDLLESKSPETQRKLVFEKYVEHMLQRRGAQTRYTTEQTIYWLRCLAKQLVQHHQTEFYIERMQPDWLPEGRLRWFYPRLIASLIFGLFSGLIFGLSSGGPFGWTGGLMGGLIFGSVSGPLCGLIFGLLGRTKLVRKEHREVKLTDVHVWSRINLGPSWAKYLLFLIAGGLELIMDNKYPQLLRKGILYSIQVNPQLLPGAVLSLFPLVLFALASLEWILTSLEEISRLLVWWWVNIHQGLVRFLLSGLIFGTPSGLLVWGLEVLLTRLFTGYLSFRLDRWDISFGLLLGLLSSLIIQLLGPLNSEIKTTEELKVMSWTHFFKKFLLYILTTGLFISILLCGIAISSVINHDPNAFTDLLITTPIPVVMFCGMFVGVIGLFLGEPSGHPLDNSSLISPNQGIRLSMQNSLVLGLGTGLVLGLGTGFIFGLAGGIIIGLLGGMFIGLFNGGLASIRHMILRLLLWHTKSLPWNYVQFLDYAAERILLRKIGGGYIFVHRLLRDYFAELDTLPNKDEHTISMKDT